MEVSKGTRSFSFDVIAVTSKLSLMSSDSMACKSVCLLRAPIHTSTCTVPQVRTVAHWYADVAGLASHCGTQHGSSMTQHGCSINSINNRAEMFEVCGFIGTLSGMQVVSFSRLCHPHRMRACCVCKASPQSTCADGAAQQVGSWTDSVSEEAHHWTGRRSEQKLGAWFPSSQTGPAGTSNFVLQIR